MSTELDEAVARLTYISKPDLNPEVTEHMEDLQVALAELERRQKMLDVCAEVHGHNVKLKAERDALRAELERVTGAPESTANRRVAAALAERDAARAEVERLRGEVAALHALVPAPVDVVQRLEADLARLRERDARVRQLVKKTLSTYGKSGYSDSVGGPDPELLRKALELLKETL